MENTDIINLWKSYDKKLDQQLLFHKKNAEEITRLRVHTLLAPMKPIKLVAIILGIVWVLFVDVLIIRSFTAGNLFFLISAGIQVLLTKLAIGIYLYQLILIHQLDISEQILKTQARLSALRSSTLWVTRILILQLPVWTTFYLHTGMFNSQNTALLMVNALVTLVFTFVAVWLFINISSKNADKRWFKMIFSGREWTPVITSMELLNQISEFTHDEVTSDTTPAGQTGTYRQT